MTKLLEKAVQKASALPIDQQDAIAAIILDEIEDEERWRAAFARSEKRLSELVAQVRTEIGAGDVLDKDPSDAPVE